MLNWIVWNRTDYLCKNGFGINNLNNNHHHVVLIAWSSLTLSCHPSLSCITTCSSSWLHPVSTESHCMKESPRWSVYITKNHTDDLVLLTNTPAQAESLLHSLKQAAGGIDLYVNTNRIEFICFKQDGSTSKLNDNLWNQWTSSHILTAIYLIPLIKGNNFFQAAAVSVLLYGCTS